MHHEPLLASLILAGACLLVVLPPAASAQEVGEYPRIAIPAAFDRLWLAEVDLWLTPQERTVYGALEVSALRERFRQEFWRIRDLSLLSRVNEVKEQLHHNRVKARELDLSPTDPRARVIALFGPPHRRFVHGNCASREVYQRLESKCVVATPFELYDYGQSAAFGVAPVLFIRHPEFERGPCVLYDQQIEPPFRIQRITPQVCDNRDATLGRIDLAQRLEYRWPTLEDAGLQAPPREPWAERFASKTQPEHPRSLSQPTTSLLLVETTELAAAQEDSPAVYRLRLRTLFATATDWWQSDIPWRNLSFRFDLFDPAVLRWNTDAIRVQLGDPGLQIVQELNFVAPAGSYTLVGHVEDESAELYSTGAWAIEVPSGQLSPTTLESGRRPASSRPPVETALDHPWIAFPGLDGVMTGSRAVSLGSWSPRVAAVRYFLDGKPAGLATTSPFETAVDFGPIPRQRTLEARADDAGGVEIATDRITVNRGAHRFALELTELPGASSGNLLLRGRVAVPGGATLATVEVFEEDRRLLQTRQNPFFLSHPSYSRSAGRRSRTATVLRAVARLDDGRTRERSIVIGGGATLQVDVELVELYASVTDRSRRPITDLEQREVSLFENDVAQELRLFRRVDELPINVVLLLDTSSSMSDEIEHVRQSGLAFLERVIRQDDLAAVLSFSHRTYAVVPFTHELETLREGSRALRAWGGTSFYDSLVLALYYLQGLEGKKAVVVVSDGADQSSDLVSEQMLEYAERSNASIYTVALGIGDVGFGAIRQARLDLKRVAQRTGGAFFEIKTSSELPKVYDQIEDDLRSQYLLAYQSSASVVGGDSGDYRPIRVELTRPRARVSARPGYYP